MVWVSSTCFSAHRSWQARQQWEDNKVRARRKCGIRVAGFSALHKTADHCKRGVGSVRSHTRRAIGVRSVSGANTFRGELP